MWLVCGVGVDDATATVFFFTDTAPPAIYTLSLHDALPISGPSHLAAQPTIVAGIPGRYASALFDLALERTERAFASMKTSS